MPEDLLITDDEAGKVVQRRESVASTYRTFLLIFVGLLIVIAAILLVLTLASLRGSRTGLEALFPFLEKTQTKDLRLQ